MEINKIYKKYEYFYRIYKKNNQNTKNIMTFLTYNNFINESLGGKNVAIFPGRFMPPHNAHIESFRKTSKLFKAPVIPIQIISKNKDKSPFPRDLMQEIGNSLSKEFSFIEKWVLHPEGLITAVPEMVRYIQNLPEDYECIGLGCGSDRKKGYELQADKYVIPISVSTDIKDTQVNVNNFDVKVVSQRVDDGSEISGTRVRELISNGDFDEFKKITPKSVHKYFKELKKYI